MSTIALRQLPYPEGQRPERAVGNLMRRYCDAIDECQTIPTLSLLPGVRLYVGFIFWILSLEFSVLTAIVDIPLNLVRLILGRPRFLLGQALYSRAASPFIDIWNGEISAVKLVSVRYLSKLFLYYHAQFRISRLEDAYNRRHLELVVDESSDTKFIAGVDEFRKSFDLFQKIIRKTSQLGILTVGGPLAALLYLIIDKAVIPLTTKAFSYVASSLPSSWDFSASSLLINNTSLYSYGTSLLTFGLILAWIFCSAWMDMRTILVHLGINKLEKNAYGALGIQWHKEAPIDLIVYLVSLVAFGLVDYVVTYGPLSGNASPEDVTALNSYLVFFGLAGFLGLVALKRRKIITERMVSVDPPSETPKSAASPSSVLDAQL
jgi:hypothetical protein